jgi:hypothetical protein
VMRCDLFSTPTTGERHILRKPLDITLSDEVLTFRKIPVSDRCAMVPYVIPVYPVRCCFFRCAFVRGEVVLTGEPISNLHARDLEVAGPHRIRSGPGGF